MHLSLNTIFAFLRPSLMKWSNTFGNYYGMTSWAKVPVHSLHQLKDNSLRLCVIHRKLNENIVKDTFPQPREEQAFDILHGVFCLLQKRARQIHTECDLSLYCLVCLFCLFVWGVSSHSRIYHTYEDFTIAGEGLHANFDLCSVLMAIEPWGFFSVPHLLWHGASVYDGHLRGPVTLAPISERLAVQLSLPVFTT